MTIREIARLAGVSIGTVSRALKGQAGLSPHTRTEVLRVAEEMGYDMSKLRSERPRRMLLVYNRHIGPFASNHFYSHVLHGASMACRESGTVLSLTSLAPSDHIVGDIQRHEPDGLLVVGYFEPETLDAIRSCKVPIVVADHFVPDMCCINDDNFHGAWLATRHLLEGGARRVAAILGPPAHHSVALRTKGFRKALFEAGIPADPELEVSLDPNLVYEASCIDAMRRLLALPQRPAAVFAYNDISALVAIRVCKQAGLRIPEGIRFIGYDDIDEAARNEPPLSTIRLDKEGLGYAAAKALIENRIEPGDTLLPVELVVRASSQPLTAAPKPKSKPGPRPTPATARAKRQR